MARYKPNRNFKQALGQAAIIVATPFTVVLIGKLFALTIAICFGTEAMNTFLRFAPIWVVLSVAMLIIHIMLATEYDKDCARKNAVNHG